MPDSVRQKNSCFHHVQCTLMPQALVPNYEQKEMFHLFSSFPVNIGIYIPHNFHKCSTKTDKKEPFKCALTVSLKWSMKSQYTSGGASYSCFRNHTNGQIKNIILVQRILFS